MELVLPPTSSQQGGKVQLKEQAHSSVDPVAGSKSVQDNHPGVYSTDVFTTAAASALSTVDAHSMTAPVMNHTLPTTLSSHPAMRPAHSDIPDTLNNERGPSFIHKAPPPSAEIDWTAEPTLRKPTSASRTGETPASQSIAGPSEPPAVFPPLQSLQMSVDPEQQKIMASVPPSELQNLYMAFLASFPQFVQAVQSKSSNGTEKPSDTIDSAAKVEIPDVFGNATAEKENCAPIKPSKSSKKKATQPLYIKKSALAEENPIKHPKNEPKKLAKKISKKPLSHSNSNIIWPSSELNDTAIKSVSTQPTRLFYNSSPAKPKPKSPIPTQHMGSAPPLLDLDALFADEDDLGLTAVDSENALPQSTRHLPLTSHQPTLLNTTSFYPPCHSTSNNEMHLSSTGGDDLVQEAPFEMSVDDKAFDELMGFQNFTAEKTDALPSPFQMTLASVSHPPMPSDIQHVFENEVNALSNHLFGWEEAHPHQDSLHTSFQPPNLPISSHNNTSSLYPPTFNHVLTVKQEAIPYPSTDPIARYIVKIDKRKELELLFEEHQRSLTMAGLSEDEDVTAEPDWVVDSSCVFSVDQMTELKSQLEFMVHNLSQSFVYSKTAQRTPSNTVSYWEDELKQFFGLFTHGMTTGSSSLFDIHLVSTISGALNLQLGSEFYENIPKPWRKPIDDKRSSFTAAETDLLLQGVTFFGFDEMKCIRAFCLPSKSEKQIKDRIRYGTDRRTSTNPIKELYLKPFKPLFSLETEILQQGIQAYGPRFRHFADHFFIRTPRQYIKRAWQSLYILGDVAIPFPNEPHLKPRAPVNTVPPVLFDPISSPQLEQVHHLVSHPRVMNLQREAGCSSARQPLPSKKNNTDHLTAKKKKQSRPNVAIERSSILTSASKHGIQKPQILSKRNASLVSILPPRPAASHVQIGRGKMYVRPSDFKHNKINTITHIKPNPPPTKKPLKRKAGAHSKQPPSSINIKSEPPRHPLQLSSTLNPIDNVHFPFFSDYAFSNDLNSSTLPCQIMSDAEPIDMTFDLFESQLNGFADPALDTPRSDVLGSDNNGPKNYSATEFDLLELLSSPHTHRVSHPPLESIGFEPFTNTKSQSLAKPNQGKKIGKVCKSKKASLNMNLSTPSLLSSTDQHTSLAKTMTLDLNGQHLLETLSTFDPNLLAKHVEQLQSEHSLLPSTFIPNLTLDSSANVSHDGFSSNAVALHAFGRKRQNSDDFKHVIDIKTRKV